MKVYNFDFDKIGNIKKNAINIIKMLRGQGSSDESCKFIVEKKEFEIRKGKLYFDGKKVATSTIDGVCDYLSETIDIMDNCIACGADEEQYASCEEYDPYKGVAEFCLQNFFPGRKFELTPTRWGDCKAVWLLDNGYVIALKEEQCVKKSNKHNKKRFYEHNDIDPFGISIYIHVTGSDNSKYALVLAPSSVMKHYSFDEMADIVMNQK